MNALRDFLRDERGASAAEFALILPVALVFLLGIIDVGRYAWAINQIEKGVQSGARHAVATDLVAGGLNNVDFGEACGGLTAGEPIVCADAFPAMTCTATGCSCAGGDCGIVTDTSADANAYNGILARVQALAPMVAAGNMTVSYRPSGLGYYGDPFCAGVMTKDGCDIGNKTIENSTDVAPIVTVAVSGVRLSFISMLGLQLRLPAFSYSLTLEDGVGGLSSEKWIN